jgi:hypothetical protein
LFLLAENNTGLIFRSNGLQALSSLHCQYALNIFFPEEISFRSYFPGLSSHAPPFKSTFFTFQYVLHDLFPAQRFVGCVVGFCTANKPVLVQVTTELRYSSVTAEQRGVLHMTRATFDDAIDIFV